LKLVSIGSIQWKTKLKVVVLNLNIA